MAFLASPSSWHRPIACSSSSFPGSYCYLCTDSLQQSALTAAFRKEKKRTAGEKDKAPALSILGAPFSGGSACSSESGLHGMEESPLGTVQLYGRWPQTPRVRMRLPTADVPWGSPSVVYSLFLPGTHFCCHQELHCVAGHTRHAQWGECSGSVLSAPSVPGTFILVWEKALPCSEHDVPMSQLTGKHF